MMMAFENFDGRNNGPSSRGYWMDNVLPNTGAHSAYHPRGVSVEHHHGMPKGAAGPPSGYYVREPRGGGGGGRDDMKSLPPYLMSGVPAPPPMPSFSGVGGRYAPSSYKSPWMPKVSFNEYFLSNFD